MNQQEFKQKQIEICNNHDVTEEERQKSYVEHIAENMFELSGGYVDGVQKEDLVEFGIRLLKGDV